MLLCATRAPWPVPVVVAVKSTGLLLLLQRPKDAVRVAFAGAVIAIDWVLSVSSGARTATATGRRSAGERLALSLPVEVRVSAPKR